MMAAEPDENTQPVDPGYGYSVGVDPGQGQSYADTAPFQGALKEGHHPSMLPLARSHYTDADSPGGGGTS